MADSIEFERTNSIALPFLITPWQTKLCGKMKFIMNVPEFDFSDIVKTSWEYGDGILLHFIKRNTKSFLKCIKSILKA